MKNCDGRFSQETVEEIRESVRKYKESFDSTARYRCTVCGREGLPPKDYGHGWVPEAHEPLQRAAPRRNVGGKRA